MRILFCGDVVGRGGRDIIVQKIPELRNSLKLDCVIVNVDNAAGGFGITKQICEEFAAVGVDVMTGGDHIWDQKDAFSFIRITRSCCAHKISRKAHPAMVCVSTPRHWGKISWWCIFCARYL